MSWRDIFGAIGVFGLAVTVFGNLQTFLSFADWVSYAFGMWNSWVHEFWSYILNAFGLHVTPVLASAFTLLSFAASLSLGSNIGHTDVLLQEGFEMGGRLTPNIAVASSIALVASIAGILAYISNVVSSPWVAIFSAAVIGICVVAVGARMPSNRLLGSLANVVLVLLIFYSMPAPEGVGDKFVQFLVLAVSSLLLAFGNSTRQRQRIVYVLTILCALIATNEIAKLHIDISAPPKAATM